MTDTIPYRGKFLHFIERDGWEFVRRANAHAVVAVAARTRADEIVLIEQRRKPLGEDGACVIELPAGLVGDDGAEDDLLAAANRELAEETGYRAGHLELAGAGPSSAGLTDEIISFVIADRLDQIGPGGGVDGEDIRVHPVPLERVDDWLGRHLAAGRMVDPKVWAGLYLLRYATAGR